MGWKPHGPGAQVRLATEGSEASIGLGPVRA